MYFDRSIWNQVIRPAFVVDEKKARANIARMAEKAHRHGMRFRPHFKTHQSLEIGNWFRDAGVSSIAVSSVSMARYFAHGGWNDITIAFPVNTREMNDINWLAYEIGINLLVEREDVLEVLLRQLRSEAGIFIEIDTGYRRTGIEPHDTERIDWLLDSIRKNDRANFRGFLTHTGQTYQAKSVDEIQAIHNHSVSQLLALKKRYQGDWPNLEISLGDTPACSVSENWAGVDEMRPGNFVFYDLMMLQLGVCHPEDLAGVLICPVVSVFPERAEAVLYGGAVHLSKEFIQRGNGEKIYGLVYSFHDEHPFTGFPGKMYLSGLSQEHGMVKGQPEAINQLKPGDLVAVFPVHSCLTADLAGEYLTDSGDIIHKMPPIRNLTEE